MDRQGKVLHRLVQREPHHQPVHLVDFEGKDRHCRERQQKQSGFVGP